LKAKMLKLSAQSNTLLIFVFCFYGFIFTHFWFKYGHYLLPLSLGL
jgi:hypothetical protein